MSRDIKFRAWDKTFEDMTHKGRNFCIGWLLITVVSILWWIGIYKIVMSV